MKYVDRIEAERKQLSAATAEAPEQNSLRFDLLGAAAFLALGGPE